MKCYVLLENDCDVISVVGVYINKDKAILERDKLIEKEQIRYKKNKKALIWSDEIRYTVEESNIIE